MSQENVPVIVTFSGEICVICNKSYVGEDAVKLLRGHMVRVHPTVEDVDAIGSNSKLRAEYAKANKRGMFDHLLRAVDIVSGIACKPLAFPDTDVVLSTGERLEYFGREPYNGSWLHSWCDEQGTLSVAANVDVSMGRQVTVSAPGGTHPSSKLLAAITTAFLGGEVKPEVTMSRDAVHLLANDFKDQEPYGRPTPKGKSYVRQFPKIGRNESCPCGSGSKYKKCHGDKP